MSLKFNSILIVTYGRSGSTLLQGVLNSIPGVLIKGENKNFLFPIFLAYERLWALHGTGIKTPKHPWYGSGEFDPTQFAKDLSLPIKNQLTGNHKEVLCYGFKEVRYAWTADNLPDLSQLRDFNVFERYLNFLTLVFPNTCFVFNTRDVSAVAESAWWVKRDKQWVKGHIEAVEKLFHQYAEKYSERSFLVDYSDVTKQTKKLSDLFAFLGADYDAGRISEVLAIEHSYKPKANVQRKAIRVIKLKDKQIKNRIKKIVIDKFPAKLSTEHPINIGGIIVTKIGMPMVSGIFLKTSEDLNEGVIGLPSPSIQKILLNNPSAENARFQFQNIELKKGQNVEILARFVDGETIPIVEIQSS